MLQMTTRLDRYDQPFLGLIGRFSPTKRVSRRAPNSAPREMNKSASFHHQNEDKMKMEIAPGAHPFHQLRLARKVLSGHIRGACH